MTGGVVRAILWAQGNEGLEPRSPQEECFMAWKPSVFCRMAILLVACVGFALYHRHWVGFAGAWFFAILAPSSSVVPIATQTMAEHRMYLPLAAIVVPLVIGLYLLAGRTSFLVCAVLAVVLGGIAIRRNEDYRSAVTLWGDTSRKLPGSSRAHFNFANALMLARHQPEAILRTPWRRAILGYCSHRPADARRHWPISK